VGRQKSRDRPIADPLRLGHQSSCECHGAHHDDEELDGQGEAAIWFDLVNGHKQYGGDDADAEDVNESQHSDIPRLRSGWRTAGVAAICDGHCASEAIVSRSTAQAGGRKNGASRT
jgi:hypothetical protein